MMLVTWEEGVVCLRSNRVLIIGPVRAKASNFQVCDFLEPLVDAWLICSHDTSIVFKHVLCVERYETLSSMGCPLVWI